MKTSAPLALIASLLVPCGAVVARTTGPATTTVAPSPNAAAPTPSPDALTPELGDGIIACRLAAYAGKDARTAISVCLEAAKHYGELADAAATDNNGVANDAACKYGTNAAVTADVADYLYERFTQTHAASAGLLKLAKGYTALVAQNGCDQKYVDSVNKAYLITHPPATKNS